MHATGSWRKTKRAVWAWAALCACMALPWPVAAQDDSLAMDRAVFEAVIRDLADSIPEVLLVDVRAVRSDQHPSLLMLFDPADMEAADAALEASRTSVLAHLGVEKTDALQDRRCFWARGGQPWPDARRSDRIPEVQRAYAARPPFVALVIGRPQPLENTGGADVRVVVVRAGSSTYEFDFFTLRRDDSGGGASSIAISSSRRAEPPRSSVSRSAP